MATNSKNLCSFCRLPRAELLCGACEDDICRSCVQRLSEDQFSMLSVVPENLKHSSYCPRCYDAHVEPALKTYTEVLERAKEVGFWSRTYKGHIPILKKGRVELVVESGRDRDDVLLKLGFQAAEQGFNGLVHGELVSKKVRDHGYQKMEWSGRALPAKIDQDKLDREEYREAHWRVLHHR